MEQLSWEFPGVLERAQESLCGLEALTEDADLPYYVACTVLTAAVPVVLKHIEEQIRRQAYVTGQYGEERGRNNAADLVRDIRDAIVFGRSR